MTKGTKIMHKSREAIDAQQKAFQENQNWTLISGKTVIKNVTGEVKNGRFTGVIKGNAYFDEIVRSFDCDGVMRLRSGTDRFRGECCECIQLDGNNLKIGIDETNG